MTQPVRIWFNRGFSLAPIAALMRAADASLDVYVSVSPMSAHYPGPTATWIDGGADGAADDPAAYLDWVRDIIDRHAVDIFVPTRRRKLIANQVIDKELADGGLIVSAKVGHANQVLPIVRYWIPHLRIVAPKELAPELERGLGEFISGVKATR